MKTNHQRGYKDPGSFRDRSCSGWTSKLTGKGAGIGNDFTNGHRGHAKAVRGAKSYIRSRDRLYNKQLVIVEDVKEAKDYTDGLSED